ncbi:MAG: shikimate dehydrogenase [Thermovirgaceae bacterium]
MITAATRLVALLGNPVGHSLSPLMHNVAFRERGLDMCYLAFEVNPGDLGKTIEGLKCLGAVGANITVPFKERALLYMDRLAPEADAVGAVNTVVFEGKQAFGHNTDINGVRETLRLFRVSRKSALLLGAGGAARAAACALGKEGWDRIWVSNRHHKRAEQLADDLARICNTPFAGAIPWGERPAEPCSLVVNATSLGLERAEWPEGLPEKILSDETVEGVLDLVYTPGARTPFVEAAIKRGIPAVGGEEVLLRQGASAFGLFTGMEAPVERMRSSMKDWTARHGRG